MTAPPGPGSVTATVAVLCSAPVLSAGLLAACEGVTEVVVLPSTSRGIEGLLAAVEPDCVVDAGSDVAAAEAYADPRAAALVQLDVDAARITVRQGGRWESLNGELSPELVRNVALSEIRRRRSLT